MIGQEEVPGIHGSPCVMTQASRKPEDLIGRPLAPTLTGKKPSLSLCAEWAEIEGGSVADES